MGVDKGGQSGVSVCEAEGGGEVETEVSNQTQENGEGSVADSPVRLHLLVHGIVVIKQCA